MPAADAAVTHLCTLADTRAAAGRRVRALPPGDEYARCRRRLVLVYALPPGDGYARCRRRLVLVYALPLATGTRAAAGDGYQSARCCW